ncbi:hypothetical protein EYR41_004219 [Orbilia oligospora]|uniref:Uncharacterized protein n=1 Tax=Orbilia oligospora TaxID=2813651 RepID=A0A7C8KBQ7_ORBOL|nr:hypothetical protein TWF751_002239 [Orbilia oligospora]TGJ72317.1 hypothetical protein EYR41_004219 [Orbilia oligospora]
MVAAAINNGFANWVNFRMALSPGQFERASARDILKFASQKHGYVVLDCLWVHILKIYTSIASGTHNVKVSLLADVLKMSEHK